jgi:hypothetical protein
MKTAGIAGSPPGAGWDVVSPIAEASPAGSVIPLDVGPTVD